MRFITSFQDGLAGAGWSTILSNIVDIFVVALAVYWLIMLSKRTRAWQVLLGLGTFMFFVAATDWLQLRTINFLLRSLLPLGPVAIVLLFYPELRNVLENLGKVAGWHKGLTAMAKDDMSSLVPALVGAVVRMSADRVGALIVIEKEVMLENVVATGIKLNSDASEDILVTIFYPGNPLHDGAVIIRDTRVLAAGCTLPLSESVEAGAAIHTRHKAALGVSETTDAAVVVVSEETGNISIAANGKLHRGLTRETLTKWLERILGLTQQSSKTADIARKFNGTLRKARLRSR